MRIDRFEDIPACASMADREAWQLARKLTRKVNSQRKKDNVEPMNGYKIALAA